jgi:hypothetical protein
LLKIVRQEKNQREKPSLTSVDQEWERVRRIAHRIQDLDGELRTTLLRIGLVAIFYTIQLINHLVFVERTATSNSTHALITSVAAAWLFVSLAVYISLRSGFMPSWLKYVVSAVDLGLVTVIAFVTSQSASPIIYAYFIIIAMAVLRFRIRLVWFVAVSSASLYMFLVGVRDPMWFDSQHLTPVINQALIVISLLSVGLIGDQTIRAMERVSNFRLSRTRLESRSEQS